MKYDLTINGEARSVDVAPGTPVLWALRDGLNMTGTKFGCGVASCGACTIHVDGVPERSCQLTVDDAVGLNLTTIEGASGPEVAAVTAAWRELDVAQCGYCQSGQIMAAANLLAEIPKPHDQDINDYMSGNACRCATYARIRTAIHRAADILEG